MDSGSWEILTTQEETKKDLFSSQENLEQFFIYEFGLIIVILVLIMFISITQ
jgi:hypothetical protein